MSKHRARIGKRNGNPVMVKGVHRFEYEPGDIALVVNSTSGKLYRSPVEYIAFGGEDRRKGNWHFHVVTRKMLESKKRVKSEKRVTHSEIREMARQLSGRT